MALVTTLALFPGIHEGYKSFTLRTILDQDTAKKYKQAGVHHSALKMRSAESVFDKHSTGGGNPRTNTFS